MGIVLSQQKVVTINDEELKKQRYNSETVPIESELGIMFFHALVKNTACGVVIWHVIVSQVKENTEHGDWEKPSYRKPRSF